MKLNVLGHRVLIKPVDPNENFNKDVPEGLKNANFQVVLTHDDEKRWFEATQEGRVIQVGSMAYRNPSLGYGLPEWSQWVKPGDKVKFVQYAKDVVEDPETKEKFFIVNDVDILARIEE